MPQQIVYTDEKEDTIVVKHSKFWKISKAETIKKIIKEYGKASKVTIILLFTLFFALAFSQKVEAQDNASLNYVWNSSCTGTYCWVPWISDETGKPKVDINLLNVSSQNVSVADSVITNYIFPYSDIVTTIKNITILQD